MYYLIKFSFCSCVLLSTPLHIGIPLLSFLYYIYHHVLMPKVFGLHPLTLADTFMLYENPTNIANYGGIALYDKIEFSKITDMRRRLIKKQPRLRQKLVNVFGSYYLKDLSLEDAEKAIIKISGLHTKKQLEDFVNSIAQTPVPTNVPLYRAYLVEDCSETEFAAILLVHHSLFDGLSNLYLTWMYGEEPGNVDLLPNVREFTLYERFMMHLTLLYSLPLALIQNLTKKKDVNPINNGKPLTGIKKFTYFDDVPFNESRDKYKKLGVTGNDYFIAIISKTFKDYFRLKDPNGKYDEINIAIPINLKSKYPRKFEEVVLENNFSGVNMRLPLIDDVSKECKKIKKVTDGMKKSAEFLATIYILLFGVLLLPRWVNIAMNNVITSKTTSCFSNLPYFKKPVKIENSDSAMKTTVGFFHNNGEVGMAISLVTYCEKVMVGLTTDTARMENPSEFLHLLRENFLNC